jgi:predicted nuclease of predicted toxin-antitoxin system
MKFLLDANIPYSALEIFREIDLEAIHVKNIGLGKSTDLEIMNNALENKSIIITKDLGFGNIKIFPPKSHQGVIILRLPFFFKASQITKELKNFLTSVNLEDLKESTTIVKLGRYRIRKTKY